MPDEEEIALPFLNLSFQKEDPKPWYISAKDEELNLRFMPWTITVFFGGYGSYCKRETGGVVE